MFRSMLLTLAAGLSLASVAAAQSVPHKESSQGQLTNVTATQMDWAAAGRGTHIGNYTEVGSHLYFPDGTLYGVFTVTAVDGSTISGTYDGFYFPLGDGTFQFQVQVYWLAGTGRLTGVTGAGNANATLNGLAGEVEVEAQGLWILPSR